MLWVSLFFKMSVSCKLLESNGFDFSKIFFPAVTGPNLGGQRGRRVKALDYNIADFGVSLAGQYSAECPWISSCLLSYLPQGLW